MKILRLRTFFFVLSAVVVAALCKQQNGSGELLSLLQKLQREGKSGHIVYQRGKALIWDSERISRPKERRDKAVTYALSGGRLGDNLLAYLHAKWISYCEGVPLVRTPFPGDSEFALSLESSVEEEAEIIPYFPEPSMKNPDPPFLVDWDDPGFRHIIARALEPVRPHTTLHLPSDRITLCVHVRRAGAFDPASLYWEYPLKFPPDSFYIEQIQTIARLFKGKKLYVFLMTDDLHPQEMLLRYRRAVPDENIQWAAREGPPENDLDDFYSIPLFDCLILPDSNFSIVASKLKNYAVRISPTHYAKKKGRIRITGVEAVFNPSAILDPGRFDAGLSAREGQEKEIELFVYWRPDLKGKAYFEEPGLSSMIRKQLLVRRWEIRSWDHSVYRPWLLSWKEVKSWQEFKWRLGWDLPAKSPFQEENKFWVFWSLGPYLKHHDFGRLPKERLAIFLWEPPTVEPNGYEPETVGRFSKVFTWDDDLVDNKRFFKFYYPVLRPRIDEIPPFEEKKFCTLFATRLCSKHPKELYSEREKIIRFFEDKPQEFDLYGRNWEKRKFKNWRGRAADKIGTLKQYKFCICYENMRDVKGYITEKIFDAFAAGCVPVYWGASNVTDWIPEDCFIDRRKFSSDQELYDHLKGVAKEQYESYLECAQNFINSDAAQLYSDEQFVKDFLKMMDR